MGSRGRLKGLSAIGVAGRGTRDPGSLGPSWMCCERYLLQILGTTFARRAEADSDDFAGHSNDSARLWRDPDPVRVSRCEAGACTSVFDGLGVEGTPGVVGVVETQTRDKYGGAYRRSRGASSSEMAKTAPACRSGSGRIIVGGPIGSAHRHDTFSVGSGVYGAHIRRRHRRATAS